MARWRTITDDCVEAMAQMAPNSVDAIVTDPPYGLEFMNKGWDTHVEQGWHTVWAIQAIRVLKPGGFLLAFGGTRTVHRLTCALEDAGFEIRDGIDWLYGNGFPKNQDAARAIDAELGTEGTWEREDHPSRPGSRASRGQNRHVPIGQMGATTEANPESMRHVYRPKAAEARARQGWGTALKPAREPIVVARKPLSERNLARNLMVHGTGALNVDATRVDSGPPPSVPQPDFRTARGRATHLDATARNGEYSAASGRWPPNVVLSHGPDCEFIGMRTVKTGTYVGRNREGQKPGEVYGTMGVQVEDAGYGDTSGEEVIEAFKCWPGCPVYELDATAGARTSGAVTPGIMKKGKPKGILGEMKPQPFMSETYGDTGSASRFFPTFRYEPKTPRRERERGVAGTAKDLNWSSGSANPGSFQAQGTDRAVRNHHPTVKPANLMAWLSKLVCPPGGIVLDPFMGSGSTGVGCMREMLDFVGIEREADYVSIARQRLVAEAPLLDVEDETLLCADCALNPGLCDTHDSDESEGPVHADTEIEP